MRHEAKKNNHLEVETEDAIYEIRFAQIQIEITGRCNMHCQHCRASGQLRQDMPTAQISKIIRFAKQYTSDQNEVILSGGEPLIHHDLPNVLKNVRALGVDYVTLTTNGYLLTNEHLRLLEELGYLGFALSVSIDNTNENEHDCFRGRKGAFARANKALRMVTDSEIPGVIGAIRTTIKPSQINAMEEMVQYARQLSCRRIGFSGIQPAGRALQRPDLWMSREQKSEFLSEIQQLDQKYPDIRVTTNDPLQCLLSMNQDQGKEDERIFGGCGAAATTFNVNADGVMTPCALLDIPMMNVFPLSIQEITEQYQTNPLVKEMLTMNLKGKCGKCRLKFQCGGCRVRALAQSGDYLGEDPHCWL